MIDKTEMWLVQEIENTTEDALQALETFLQESSPSKDGNLAILYGSQGLDAAQSKSPRRHNDTITVERSLVATSQWLNSSSVT